MTPLEQYGADIIDAVAERRSARLVSDVYLAPLSEAECADHVRRLQFSQLGPTMARAMRRPPPSQAMA